VTTEREGRNSRLRRGLGARGLAARFSASHFDCWFGLKGGFECVGGDGRAVDDKFVDESAVVEREKTATVGRRAGL
jgi:hypothetical protein